MRKLCLVIPSLHAGGMERVMSELAGYFCDQPDLEIHMVMYGMKPELFYPTPSNLIIHQSDWAFNNSQRFWSTLKRMVYLRRTIKQIDPVSILSFGEYWNNFVLIALKGLKYPVFVSDRCQPNKTLGKLHDLLRKYLYPRAAGVIAQTGIAKEIYKKVIPIAKITVIGNPIRKIINDNKIPKENIVLSVGRLIKSKHHDELIRLFVKINKPDWTLVIVGGDAIKQQNMSKLKELVRKLNAEDKVILTGSISDVDHYYQKSKIFAFTSSSEGFPNVIGEAMSAGLPVIAFDCTAGPSEMIEDEKTGFVVELFDYKIFSEKLKLLMTDESLRQDLGKNAIFSIKKFGVDKIGEKFFSLITSNL